MAKIEEYIDPTTGQRNYSDGRSAIDMSNVNFDDLSDEDLIKLSEQNRIRLSEGMANPAAYSMQATPSPVEYIGNRVGESRYDKRISSMGDVDEIMKFRHEMQPWHHSLGAAAVQSGTMLAGQLLQGVGFLLDPAQMINVAMGAEKEWGNQLTRWGDELINSGQNIAPIYQDPDKEGGANFGDWSWWMGNMPSVVSTLSFFIPSLGVTKAVSALGKIGGISSKMNKAFRVGAKGVIGGVSSRYMESSMESSQLMQEFMNMAGTPLTAIQAKNIQDEYGVEVMQIYEPETGETYWSLSEESAMEAGAKAAANNFRANMALAAVDIPQFVFATSPFGSVTKKMTSSIATALGKSGALVAVKNIGAHALNMASEGAEEAYQYISSERSKEVELARMGLIDEEEFSESFKRYVKDGEFITSATFGALGAGVMIGGSNLMHKISAKRSGEVSENDRRLADVQSWMPKLEAASKAMAAAEVNGDPRAFKRIQYDNMVPIAIEAAKNGNLGHLSTLIESSMSDKESAMKTLGLQSQSEYDAFVKNSEKMLEVINSVEEVFQANVDKEGNWALAEAQTRSDARIPLYTELASSARDDANREISNPSNWTFDATSQQGSVSPDMSKRIIFNTQIANLGLEKKALEKSISDLNKSNSGKGSFLSQRLSAQLKVLDKKIENTIKESETHKESYTDAQYKEDSSKNKLTETGRKRLSDALKELTKSELELAYNQDASQFYRTEEGRAMFDRTRYEVQRNKAKREVESMTSPEDIKDASEVDETGGAKEAINDKAKSQAEAVKTSSVEDTFGVPSGEQIAPEAPTIDPNSKKESDYALSHLNDYSESPHLMVSELDELSKSVPSEYKARFDSFRNSNLTWKSFINQVISDYLNGSAVAGQMVKAFNSIVSKREASVDSANKATTTQTDVVEEKQAEIDEIREDLPKQSESAPTIWDRVVTSLSNGIKRITFGVIGNNTMVSMRFNGKLLDPMIDIKTLEKFDITPNDKIYIALAPSKVNGKMSGRRYAEESIENRKYLLVLSRGGKDIVIGVLPSSEKKGLRKEEADTLKSLRTSLYEYFNKEGNDKGPGGYSYYSGPDKSPISVTRVVGYTAELNTDRDDSGKAVYSSPVGKKLWGNKRKSDNSKLSKRIEKAGGFIIGYVDGTNTEAPTKIDFPDVNDAPDIKDKSAQSSVTFRRDASMNLLSTAVESDGSVKAVYFSPFDQNHATELYPDPVERNKFIMDNYGHERVFDASSDGSHLEDARSWIVNQYKAEASGNIYIGIPSPMKDGDILLSRAFYSSIGELRKSSDKRVVSFIDKVDKLLLGDGSAVSGPQLLAELKKILVFSSKDNKRLKEMFSDISDIKNASEGIAIGDAPFGMLPQIINGASIKFDAGLRMNQGSNWNMGDEHPILGADNVPFNEAISPFIYTDINQEQPLKNITPLIDVDSMKTSNAKEISKKPEVSNATAPKEGATMADLIGKENSAEEIEKNSVVPQVPTEKDNTIQDESFDGELDIDITGDIIGDMDGADAPKAFQTADEVVKEGSKEELEWFKSKFPNIPINDLKEISKMVREVTSAGHTAWGAFYNSAIYLRDGAPEGTVYHEAFHVLFNLALSNKEKEVLLAKAEGKNELEKEEWLAEKFKEILLSRNDKSYDKSIKGVVSNMFKKLKMFLRSIWNSPVSNMHELAYRVNKGKYVNLKGNSFADTAPKLYREIEGWSHFKTKEAVNAINAYLVNGIIPAIRSKYPSSRSLNDADVLNWYNSANNNKFAIHKLIHDNFKKIALSGGISSEKALMLKELYTHMFNADGKPQKLVLSALEEFGKNNDMVMTVRGLDNSKVTIDDYVKIFDEQERQSEVYDVNFIAKSYTNDVTPKIKNLIRYIKKGKSETNMFGLPSYYDFNDVDKALLKDISGSLTTEELKRKLALNIKKRPEYQYILDRISKDGSIATAMMQAYGRPLMSYTYVYRAGNRSVLKNANKGGVESSLMSSWRYNSTQGTLLMSRQDGSGAVIVDKKMAQKVESRYNDIKEDLASKDVSIESATVFSKILDSVGISDVSPEDIIKINSSISQSQRNRLYGNYGFDSFIKMLSNGDNPFEKTDSGGKVNKFPETIANHISSIKPDMYEGSHMSIGGEKVYSYIIPSFVTTLMHNMHNLEETIALIDKFTKDPLFASKPAVKDGAIDNDSGIVYYNRLLQRLAFAAAKYNQIKEDSLDGEAVDYSEVEAELRGIIQIGIIEGVSQKARGSLEYSKMNDRDLKQLALELFFNNNNTKSATFRMVPLSDSPNSIGIETEKLSADAAITALVKMAEGEYQRIRKIRDQIKNLKPEDRDKNYHSERNASTDTGYLIVDDFNGTRLSPLENKEKAAEFLKKNYLKKANEYVDKLERYKIVVFNKNGSINLKKSSLPNEILIANNSRAALVAFVNEYLLNYTVAIGSFTSMSVGDPAFYSEKVSDGAVTVPRAVDYFKRAKEIFSPKSIPDIEAAYQTPGTDSNPNGETIQVRPEYKGVVLRDEYIAAISRDAINEMLNSNVEAGIISREAADKIMKEYEVINHADGQAFITLDFYRQTMIAHDRWTDNHQRVYDLAVNGKAGVEDLVVFQPIKPFMYNHDYNITYGGMAPNQHKNSEFILLPSMVKNNPRLKAIHDYMVSNNIDIANFESAVKVGLNGAVKIDDLIAGEQAKVQTHKMMHRGIQMETPEHHVDSSGKFGSQLRKIIISDLDPTADYIVGGEKMKASELVSFYQELIMSNLKDSYGRVADEFLTNGEIDMEKVSLILRLNAESSLMSEDFIDSIKVDKSTGMLRLPVFDELFSNKMESVFTSMARNGITNQKINQMALIQVASIGLSEDLKLVFSSEDARVANEKNFEESKNIVTFAKLESSIKELLEKKGYTEAMWNTLTENEKEHATKCATF